MEKRRVFAVDALFGLGALEIEITNVGQTDANLLADGTDFFVDANNNLTFEFGEVRGAIADLQSIHVYSNDSIGKLFWNGDFSLAPLAIPLGTGEVVRTEGLSEVDLQASFSAAGNVSLNSLDSIRFDASIQVQGNLSASVSPGGTILDGANAAIMASGDVVLQSQNDLILGDEATSSWYISGLTRVVSDGNVELGLVGEWDSSVLSADANDIYLIDQNSISLVKIHATGDFQLTAIGTVTDQIGTDIVINGTAFIQGKSIDLADSAGDSISITGNVSLLATAGNISLATLGDVTLGDITASGTSVTLFEDANTTLASIQTPGAFSSTSSGSITDVVAASIQAGTMALEAGGPILLADNNDVVNISGAVSLVSASSVTIASPGSVTLGDITASGTSITLFEDANTTLASIQTPGAFSSTSSGSITDVVAASIQAGTVALDATGSIFLADDLNDTIQVTGSTTISAGTGGGAASIELGVNGTVKLSDVVLNVANGDITVGGSGHTELGVIEARGGDIAIHEDTSMVVRALISKDRLVLSSGESILNTAAYATNGTLGISAKSLFLEAETFAHLGPISVDRLNANVGANGELIDLNLFALNLVADRNGQSYLDSLGENLPPGIAPIETLLNGETISQLRSKASFVQSFGTHYGLFVQNNKELTVDNITATGDGVHVLIETARGTDLTIDGIVQQRFTQSDAGGVVLIAGDQLVLAPGAELRIEHVSLDVSTSRVIRQPSLIANAFDGGRGPAGFESTRDVLYASDAFANTNTQNTIQRVSTQFGTFGEAGFQTLVRYADGSSQLFDANEELGNSLQSNPSANRGAGVIAAHVASAGDVAGMERNRPFEDDFLGRFQTLPTTAIFRRSSEFFIFEQSGAVDSSLTRVDLTPVVDPVADVFSPGRKISFSLPTEITISPVVLVAPIRIAPEGATPYANISNPIEPKVLSGANIEVFIINVGFEDLNQDGQPADSELPARNEVQVESNLQLTEASKNNEYPNEHGPTKRTNLAHGEPNASTKEIKGSIPPSASEIESWISEYRDDPNKPSGAYAIISVDSVQGVKVLKVFGVRDYDITTPDPAGDVDVLEASPRTDEDSEKPQNDADSTSFNSQLNNIVPNTIEDESLASGSVDGVSSSSAIGTLWVVSRSGNNRFGRMARLVRSLQKSQSGGQNA